MTRTSLLRDAVTRSAQKSSHAAITAAIPLFSQFFASPAPMFRLRRTVEAAVGQGQVIGGFIAFRRPEVRLLQQGKRFVQLVALHGDLAEIEPGKVIALVEFHRSSKAAHRFVGRAFVLTNASKQAPKRGVWVLVNGLGKVSAGVGLARPRPGRRRSCAKRATSGAAFHGAPGPAR